MMYHQQRSWRITCAHCGTLAVSKEAATRREAVRGFRRAGWQMFSHAPSKDWCGRCTKRKQSVEEMARELADNMKDVSERLQVSMQTATENMQKAFDALPSFIDAARNAQIGYRSGVNVDPESVNQKSDIDLSSIVANDHD